jgi:hypothetical protein
MTLSYHLTSLLPCIFYPTICINTAGTHLYVNATAAEITPANDFILFFFSDGQVVELAFLSSIIIRSDKHKLWHVVYIRYNH